MKCPRLAALTLLLGLNAASALEAEDVPFVVQWRSRKEGKNGYAVCTGSLVTPTWVLTAKHCAVGLLSNRAVTVTIHFFNPAKVEREVDLHPVKLKMSFSLRTVPVVEAHAPPNKRLDIALVKLGQAVTNVPLAVLDAVRYGKRQSTTVFPVGASGGLHWAGPKEANGTRNQDKIYVDNTGGSGGMRGGDSGGPWIRKLDSSAYTICGVISGGMRRGKRKLGKAYQPAFVRGWIDEVTNNAALWSDSHLKTSKEFAEVGVVAAPRSSIAAPLVAAVGLAVFGLGVAVVRRARAPAVKEEESPILE